MRQEINPGTVVAAIPDQVSSDLADEVIILELESGTYYGLDAVGARIWNHVQEPSTVHEIIDRLMAEYEVERQTCTEDVLALLREMRDEKLITVVDD